MKLASRTPLAARCRRRDLKVVTVRVAMRSNAGLPAREKLLDALIDFRENIRLRNERDPNVCPWRRRRVPGGEQHGNVRMVVAEPAGEGVPGELGRQIDV